MIEVMANVNVPFGTEYWRGRGQEENAGEERSPLPQITSGSVSSLRKERDAWRVGGVCPG